MAEKNVRVMPGMYEDTDSDQVYGWAVCLFAFIQKTIYNTHVIKRQDTFYI